MSADARLITALDLPTVEGAKKLVAAIGDAGCFYKIGLQLFPLGGMDLCRELKSAGHGVFLDFKLHDISATVEKATRSIAPSGADYLTIHAEPPVMRAAHKGREGSALKLLGVTVMTSYDDAMLKEMGFAYGARDLVLMRTEQALEAGCDGVIASAHEAAELRTRFGPDFDIVTPGIRPAGSSADDQARVATPADAIAMGATRIVVGRPVNAASDPRAAALAINAEMAGS
ncbi:orotidine 5'-phosphate decarboxylase [Glycocaulis albus]|uniref:Orotidine 5'-phosphate decarboxylase n=1 Tax=Glycocaulis albus TaxID=1382801 RepID=A0ABQ1XES2_9PROT|nr:orotidine-5'-phosphate decarboxylase [Glycocaulis albus]GGG91120.1 orotidine 5'-phosphate decarboxylase [Glycocaulis albus]